MPSHMFISKLSETDIPHCNLFKGHYLIMFTIWADVKLSGLRPCYLPVSSNLLACPEITPWVSALLGELVLLYIVLAITCEIDKLEHRVVDTFSFNMCRNPGI